MNEIVIVSGKGGTGKTSLTAAFTVLAKKCVAADCDVDAADMRLLLAPTTDERHEFNAGKVVRFRTGLCSACGKCAELCSFDAIKNDGPGNGLIPWTPRVEPYSCEGCGLCAYYCPEEACVMEEATPGEWFISNTRCGPLIHARLKPGFGNSGKLVSLVKEQARSLAKEKGSKLLLIDGPPGVGCPVIASLSGATVVVIVAEPTLSSKHDAQRVTELAKSFSLRTALIINKADIDKETSQELRSWAQSTNVEYLGDVRYDKKVTKSQVVGRTVIEYAEDSELSEDIKTVWFNLQNLLE